MIVKRKNEYTGAKHSVEDGGWDVVSETGPRDQSLNCDELAENSDATLGSQMGLEVDVEEDVPLSMDKRVDDGAGVVAVEGYAVRVESRHVDGPEDRLLT